MSRTSTDPGRVALNGPTMGTRWTALFYAPPGADRAGLQAALQAAVDEVDAQMSTWRADSDLMRLNAAPAGRWVAVPDRLREVLSLGLAIGRASGGAFDIATGDAVRAWGFGPDAADPEAIRAALATRHPPAHEAVEIRGACVRRTVPVALDLNGIAKGYGVDRLAAVLRQRGIADALVGIDGELRALGLRPDRQAWTIAVEAPDERRRAARSIVALQDAAIATSGNYRKIVTLRGERLSHVMDPARGAPLANPPASVTVVAPSCAEADAWATALMVLGAERGAELAARLGLNALFLLRDGEGRASSRGVGRLFSHPERTPAA